MNSEPENFDALRHLLALKRHEVPPPGYFDLLPRRISSRLRANEGAPTFFEAAVEWLRVNASVAYAFSLTACGAFAMTVICAARMQSAQADAQPRDLAVSWMDRNAAALAGEAAEPVNRNFQPANWIENTNPSSSAIAAPSLFARPMQPSILPAAYEAAAN